MRVRLLIAVVAALVCAPAAHAGYESTKLAETASIFAMEPVKVTCSERGEDFILDFEAWGYVYLGIPEIHMGVYLCHAAENVTSDEYGLSLRALAVMVLIHESYHTRSFWDHRGDEGRVQCKAIRHFRYGAQMLGASPELATELRTYALIWHWRLAARHPAYSYQGCKVPRP